MRRQDFIEQRTDAHHTTARVAPREPLSAPPAPPVQGISRQGAARSRADLDDHHRHVVLRGGAAGEAAGRGNVVTFRLNKRLG